MSRSEPRERGKNFAGTPAEITTRHRERCDERHSTAERPRAGNAPSATLYRGIRLFTIAFLLLVLTLFPDFLQSRPGLWEWVGAGCGLAVFITSYIRVVCGSIPRSERLHTPWALTATIVSGLALLAVLPENWIYYLPFYVLTCLVITQAPWLGLLSAGGFVLVIVCAGLLRGQAPMRLTMLATQLVVFSVTLSGIHQVIEFTITRWETQKASERLAGERERRRLSRDLHDLVGRDLVALVMRAEVAARHAPGTPAGEEMSRIAALARTALNNTLAVVEEMRAPDVTTELEEARELLGWAGIDLAVFGRPGKTHQCAPFAWFLREAVTNVAKHSGAQTCRVIFGPGRLTVEDDGRPKGPVVPGAGLTGLRERLEQAGAELVVSRSREGGVRVTARLVEGCRDD
ncbi:two-component sensor histidine kinase [Microbispora rosea subsp. aerata]|nr:histidine kinase [Microbispora rosea]GGO06685.1 two-component sensor histidine kinase [Microbispora rosea subsp. aerata]GIH55065.1 two-component sensor histidine kinase [Microbispora rosea subsp. aerata]GLJ82514.1 two-component sensor histidine kinase [Microbispora rosea subsp. aerata]